MTYIIILLVSVLFTLLLYFVNHYNTLKKEHYQTISRLQDVIKSLNEKNKLLSQTNKIAENYQIQYLENRKVLGDTIVDIQKTLLEIVSYSKNS